MGVLVLDKYMFDAGAATGVGGSPKPEEIILCRPMVCV